MSFVPSRARALIVALSLLCAASAVHAQTPAAAPSAPVPIAHFFEESSYYGARLSPNARLLAIQLRVPGQRTGLFMLDIETSKLSPVATFNDMDIGQFRWVNNERLMFTIADRTKGQRDVRYAPGLYVIQRDGSGLRQLVDPSGGANNNTGTRISSDRNSLPWHTYMLGQAGAQNSEFVYVQSTTYGTDRKVRHVDLLKLNTSTGRATPVKRPPHAQNWLLDSEGEPRAVQSINEETRTSTLYLRDKGSDEWRQINTTKLFEGDENALVPLGFGPDGTLFVSTNNGSNDTRAVHTFDAKTGKVSDEPLIKTPGYDFDGVLIENQDRVVGMQFTTDAESTIWFDPAMTALQKRIDDLLPATVNLLSIAKRPETPWVMVSSYSDVQPMSWMLFNTATGKFLKIGDAHEKIKAAQMSPQQQITYTARDGMKIPALLTLPRGKRKDLPLVVLVHGGPWVRGSTWGWDRESQFLASRGYAVLEPSFRGTTGLGIKHAKASYKQWGLAMQDDLADGAKWAIDKGIASPQRICIAGASYGGYATLMGLAKDPDLFKCGVNWVGVTDIDLLYKGHWSASSDMSALFRDHGATVMIGDPKKDAAQLKATSPIQNASKITQPLILAYGLVDERVPIYHGEKFYDAVKANNKQVDWIVYPEEGHGWTLLKNNIDFWSKVEVFLDKHIGKNAAPK
jgi:dipeptidyl aminopeptidase/acylaminoacyl peptidase